jgi:hypothetical protein
MQVIEAPVAGEVRHYQMLIGGEWVRAKTGQTFDSINPYDGKTWAILPEAGEADVDAAVRAARAAFDEGPWGRMTGTERSKLMRRLAAVLAENAERLATVESTDNGKLIREMQGQLKSLPEWYYYFAGAAASNLLLHLPPAAHSWSSHLNRPRHQPSNLPDSSPKQTSLLAFSMSSPALVPAQEVPSYVIRVSISSHSLDRPLRASVS